MTPAWMADIHDNPHHRIENEPLLDSFAFPLDDIFLEITYDDLARLQDIVAYTNSRYLDTDWIAVEEAASSLTDATHHTPKEPKHMPLLCELPDDLQPRNRLILAGPGALSNSELLAIAIGSGRRGASALNVATELLSASDGLLNLARTSPEELAHHHGIGPAKAAQIVAAFELGRRVASSTRQTDATPVIRSPADVANLVMVDMMGLEQEELRVLLLNTKNVVMKMVTLYRGNVNTAVVRVGEVFKDAVRLNATGIIVVHNHPSSDATPSPEDVRVTEQIVEAGRLLDIELMDHIIIGHNRYVSMKERGLGF